MQTTLKRLLFGKGGGRPDGPRTPDDPHKHQTKTDPGGHEDGRRKREVAQALGSTTVRQHTRTSQTGKVETVRQHSRKVITDMGASMPMTDTETGASLGTLARYGVWDHDERKGAHQVIDTGDDLEALKQKHGITDDPVPLRSTVSKGLTLAFGKSTVKQHPRKNKSGKTSTVKQYTDSRTKHVHGSEGPKHETTKLGIGTAITKIRGVARHRNGMSGAPFDVVSFDYMDPMPKPKLGEKPPKPGEPRQMVAVVFDEPGHIAVFDAALLGEGKTAFGDNSWRGDQFEQPLRAAIEKNYKDLFPDKGKPKTSTALNSAGKQVKVTIPPKETDEERRDAGRALDDDHKRQEKDKP